MRVTGAGASQRLTERIDKLASAFSEWKQLDELYEELVQSVRQRGGLDTAGGEMKVRIAKARVDREQAHRLALATRKAQLESGG